MRADFASDNVSGIAPEALRALLAANEGFMQSYGKDPLTAKAADLIRDLLATDAEVYFCSSGTAANAIALAAACAPLESIVAHEHAHIFTEEAGAPAFFGNGLGSIAVQGRSGKISGDGLRKILAQPEDSSGQPPGVLSLSNATEYGTVYSQADLGELTALAKASGLAVHIDGARLSNAAAAGFDVSCIARAGVDVLCMGGAKSGMPPTEAIVVLNKALSRRFRTRLKQAGQLISKGRFCAAPWVGMLECNAWLEHARHANAMAAKLADGMPFDIAHPVEANAVFVHMDGDAYARLRAAGWLAVRFADGTVRFMCSWATTQESLDELTEALKGIV